MNRTLPPLGWIRAFECAAQHLSFTAAANELGMTQSAVSQQIRSLESKLGCKLFVRKHRSLALTDEGRKLLPEISRGIEAIRSATAPFKKQGQPDVLTVATSVSVSQWYIAPMISEFTNSNPFIKIRLLTSVWPDELRDATDVQIRFGMITEPGYEPLGSNELIMVASPELIGENSQVHLSDEQLSEYNLIEAVGTSDTWRNKASQFGLHNDHQVSLYVDSHGLAVDMAIAGAGVALTSKLIATPALTSGLLVQTNDAAVSSHDGYFIGVTSKHHAAAANLFVDWMQKLV